MKRETLDALNAARREGRAVVRAVELETGEETLIDPYTDDSGLAAFARQAARDDRSGPAEIGGHTWFLTVYNPPLDLVIVGAVHIAQPLSRMAILAGYGVRVLDPRTAFATQERFPGITLVHAWADEALRDAPPGPRSAVVALTHDPKLDDPALGAALRSNCFYIGALGSKKTHAGRLARLKQSGWSDEAIARIHGPIGLDIGAKSPAEIAVAILAEITQVLRTGRGTPRAAP
ncbi:MAG TPA: XdhC family protein [Rhizomicrobium sp.]|nr:XdhC family protein [Rhizomicrobium sp.]